MSGPPPPLPPNAAPPAVPEGWKAEWSGENNAWYVFLPYSHLASYQSLRALIKDSNQVLFQQSNANFHLGEPPEQSTAPSFSTSIRTKWLESIRILQKPVWERREIDRSSWSASPRPRLRSPA
jgi:hypothetical protein